MSGTADIDSSRPGDDLTFFRGFARIWACATLVHQLAFTFWAEAWPGWVLVITAMAVLHQPGCLYRFSWLIMASLLNLINKLPFVPNHILFEGMVHLTMLAGVVEVYLRKGNGGRIWVWNRKSIFLVSIVAIKLFYHLGPIPNNYLLGIITTAALVLAIGLHLFDRQEVILSGESFFAKLAPVLRVALMLMYFWAAIQKMNIDYFNPEISCAAKLHIEIGKYFGELIPTKTPALHFAIWASLLFEIGIPILLMIPRTRTVGFISAVWFHLWLSIHPAAGIYSFTSLILAMLFLFVPIGMRRQLQSQFQAQQTKFGGGDPLKGDQRTILLIKLVFFILLAIQIAMYLTQSRSEEVFRYANRVGFIGFFAWALWLGIHYAVASLKFGQKDNRFPNRPVPTMAWVGLLLVLFNGVFPWLGGKTQTSFSMYSNLRSEGQGNHLFLKRVDLFPFQKNLVEVIEIEPNLLDPTNRPSGIANFANPGHHVLPYFEFRRLVSTHSGDLMASYEYQGEIRQLSRKGDSIQGDEALFEPIPLVARKLLWFRRLNQLEGPMPCTH